MVSDTGHASRKRSQETFRLLGVEVDCRALADLAEEVADALEGGIPIVFACANPHSLVAAAGDREFLAALRRTDHLVADGVGVTLFALWANGRLLPRITGFDYFGMVMERLARRGGGRVFFLGSTREVLDRIELRIAREYPSIVRCSTLSPPFGGFTPSENENILRAIKEASPDVLWVGMTAPLQEKWVDSVRERLQVPVVGSIGAVFDFFAGSRPRAPAWMRRSGLEWLHRFCQEPRRMWRRNFVSVPRFLGLAVRERLWAGKGSPPPSSAA